MMCAYVCREITHLLVDSHGRVTKDLASGMW
jgi:hypothetical protein